MLHLHYILWLNGNLGLADLKIGLLKNEVYASQMIIYLDIIILCCVNEAILQTSILLSNQYISLSARGCQSNSDLLESINHDSNAVAAIKYIYSSRHNAIYFKYVHGKNRQYQFDFPY